LTDTSLYIYMCVKHFGMANIKKITKVHFVDLYYTTIRKSAFCAQSAFVCLPYDSQN